MNALPDRPRRPPWLVGAALILSVHGEALLRQPGRYLMGLIWLVVGKRVRGRNQLSALIGSSRQAYALWMARREPQSWPLSEPASGRAAFIIAIDARLSLGHLPKTLHSIQFAGVPDAVIVLADPASKLPAGSYPADLPVRWAGGLSDLFQEMKQAEGTWLLMLKSGDRLAPNTLLMLARAAREGASLCYADDDLIDRNERRHTPHFKPDWNAELFRYHDYISGAAAVRLDPALLGFLLALDDPDWIEGLTRAAVELAEQDPTHVPHVLMHRLNRPQPAPPEVARPVLEAPPSVTVIIPTRNHLELLSACLKGLEQTLYSPMDVIIIDNGSDDLATIEFLEGLDTAHVRVLRQPGDFNYAALNNSAVALTESEYLCFLNNDVSMIEPDWLLFLVAQARRGDVGAVGARLLYPDGTIQHAGVVLGVGGGAGHAHRGEDPTEAGYFQRAGLPQFVSAVTGACLVVARKKFLAVGGFDAELFPVAFNDVDLCLKLNARGWQSLYEPRAELFHYESKSRGTDHAGDKKLRFAGELAQLKGRWRTDTQVDPYHHLALSRFSEKFVIGL